jgi:hypothetical protein
MNTPEQYHQNQLAEYEELRAEIRYYLDRKEKNTYFAILLTAGVLASGIKLENPYLFLVSALLLSSLWYDQIRTISAVFRVGTYIQLAIESQTKGLNWETYGASHPIQSSLLGRIFANAIFPVMFVVHASATFLVADWPLPWKASVLALLFILLLSMVRASYVSLSKGRARELARWEQVLSQFNKT